MKAPYSVLLLFLQKTVHLHAEIRTKTNNED